MDKAGCVCFKQRETWVFLSLSKSDEEKGQSVLPVYGYSEVLYSVFSI